MLYSLLKYDLEITATDFDQNIQVVDYLGSEVCLITHVKKDHPTLSTFEETISSSYMESWQSVLSLEHISETLAVTPFAVVLLTPSWMGPGATKSDEDSPSVHLSAQPNEANETGSRVHPKTEGRMPPSNNTSPRSDVEPVRRFSKVSRSPTPAALVLRPPKVAPSAARRVSRPSH